MTYSESGLTKQPAPGADFILPIRQNPERSINDHDNEYK
jgi:hypothetical protein